MTEVVSTSSIWRGGIIAAGRGERLGGDGGVLKPLVMVGGRPLINHVLHSLAEVQPAEVVIIINEGSLEVRRHVDAGGWPFPVRWLVETTPSSMHSFLRVVETLMARGDDGPFLVSTVDTIAPARAFRAFAHASEGSGADVVLAVTPVADDDRPLLVRMDQPSRGRPRVEAIGPRASGAAFMTAGYYRVMSSALAQADKARGAGLSALRAYFEWLLDAGSAFEAVIVPPGVDVDRPADVVTAEAMLRQLGAPCG